MATTEAKKASDRRYYRKHKEKFIDYQRDYRRKIRLEAIDLYGGECVCCGEARYQFLAFDHINGGGSKDWRRKKRGAGWLNNLIKNRPEGIQLLCHNCNSAKAFYGRCPHGKVEPIIFDSSEKIKFY